MINELSSGSNSSINKVKPSTSSRNIRNAVIGRKPRSKQFIKVLICFIVWYIFGSISNIYCKEFLIQSDDPIILTLCQYIVSVTITCSYLLYEKSKKPEKTNDIMNLNETNNSNNNNNSSLLDVPQEGWRIFLIIGIVNAFGHLMTNSSMASVAVSFTHTIKATEPIFSLFFTFFLFKQRISRMMALSLIPIIGGTMLTTIFEVTYSNFGFFTAILSNILFSTRNIYSKRFQTDYPSVSSSELFLLLNLFGIVVLFPGWIISSWFHYFFSTIDPFVVEEAVVAAVSNENILYNLLMASITHCVYNLSSLLILEHITPVSHSIGNSLRRVYIVIFALVWFKHPMNPMNFIGTLIALLGVVVYCYSSAKYNEFLEKRKRSKQVLLL